MEILETNFGNNDYKLIITGFQIKNKLNISINELQTKKTNEIQ
jgi:hypothetical protein